MKYVVAGSLGNISKPLAEKLLAAGHTVTLISSNPKKKEQIEAMGAQAAIGSVEDREFLTETFRGADAVYTMVPPTFTPSDWKKYIAGIGQNYASAIKACGVKYVVNLSSVGAHMPEGCGPVSGLFYVEKALNELEDVNVMHLRAGFFYNNFLSSIGMIQNMGIIGGNYGQESKMVMVHPVDIAEVAAEELMNLSFTGKNVRYVASDERTTTEIAAALGKVIGKNDLPWINFTDEESFAGMQQAGVPDEIASNYTEMGAAVRNGEMFSDYNVNRPATLGKTKLEDFAQYFAEVYDEQTARAYNIEE